MDIKTRVVVKAAVSNAARGKPARDRLATLHFPIYSSYHNFLTIQGIYIYITIKALGATI